MVFRFEMKMFLSQMVPPPIMGGGWTDEQWTNNSFSVAGFPSSIQTRQLYLSISRGSSDSVSQLLCSIHHHALRSTDFQGEFERYCYLSGRYERQTVPCRNPWGNRKKHLGRCQREQELEDFRGLCAGPHPKGLESLFRRKHRNRSCSDRLCPRLHNHRPLSFSVSLGTFPSNQAQNQASHLVRPERQHPQRCHCYTRQDPRHEFPGSAGFRTRCLLRHGSRLSGLPQTLQNTSVLCLPRHLHQAQFPVQATAVNSGVSGNRIVEQPDRSAFRGHGSEGISDHSPSNSVCKPRYGQATIVSYQQFHSPGPLNCVSVQVEMAGGAVL